MSRASLLAAGLLTAIWGSAHPALAAQLSFSCEELDAGRPAQMTLTYEGDESGTLKLNASFGEMELRATLATREAEVDGMQLKATGIRAFGPATVAMPDRAAIEACIAAKTKPNQIGDTDIFALLLESCRPAAPLAKAPVEIEASIEVAMMPAESEGQPPEVEVYIKRTYLEESDVPGGTFAIESFPPPRCTLAQGDE